MLYFIAVLLGLLCGFLYKKSLAGFLEFRIEKAYIFLCALGLQIFTQVFASKGLAVVIQWSILLMGMSYLLLLLGFWFNRHYSGMLAIGLGCFLNSLAILGNGGKMPVSLEVLQKTGNDQAVNMLLSGTDGKHILLGGTTRFAFLADVLSPPGFLGMFMRVVSIGDIIVVIGLFLVVFEVIVKNRVKKV